jgi:hypothetical protein
MRNGSNGSIAQGGFQGFPNASAIARLAERTGTQVDVRRNDAARAQLARQRDAAAAQAAAPSKALDVVTRNLCEAARSPFDGMRVGTRMGAMAGRAQAETWMAEKVYGRDLDTAERAEALAGALGGFGGGVAGAGFGGALGVLSLLGCAVRAPVHGYRQHKSDVARRAGAASTVARLDVEQQALEAKRHALLSSLASMSASSD